MVFVDSGGTAAQAGSRPTSSGFRHGRRPEDPLNDGDRRAHGYQADGLGQRGACVEEGADRRGAGGHVGARRRRLQRGRDSRGLQEAGQKVKEQQHFYQNNWFQAGLRQTRR